ncbi:hypothetical protein HMPREF3038_03088 [Akkermansia sp. KLE1797]|nr:hypothetical protein HMPREF3038_03088 [Akkermansia sp. KLE1797]KXU55290.1 hypothetical protein HMPREF3039_00513 [Akkermansia sp. KLE1798]KZA03601.1 hypothetical protein HMPREF1326_02732 [Akkermansia sp. KLE1605]
MKGSRIRDFVAPSRVRGLKHRGEGNPLPLLMSHPHGCVD